jgi:hypothetical protein
MHIAQQHRKSTNHAESLSFFNSRVNPSSLQLLKFTFQFCTGLSLHIAHSGGFYKSRYENRFWVFTKGIPWG